MTTLEENWTLFCQKLSGVKQTPNGIEARCPSHDDHKASLTASLNAEKILLKCQAGCSFASIAAALDMEQGQFSAPKHSGGAGRKKEVDRYRYENAEGQHVFDVVRFEPKDFRPQRPDGKWKLEDVERVPYRLPQMLEAINQGKAVALVEGEKDCDNAAKIGVTATTFCGGAGKFRDEYLEWFKEAIVVCIPDNDDPGRKGTSEIASRIATVAKKVIWLELPDLPEKGDLSDWLRIEGNDLAAFRKLLKGQGREWTPDKETKPSATTTASYGGGHFLLEPDAVKFQPPPKVTKGGDVEQQEKGWICSRLEVLAATRNTNSEAWGRLLCWTDSDGKGHEWAAPTELLEGDGAEIRKELAHKGLRISPSRKARELLLAYLKIWPSERRARCVDKLGWHGDVYVTPKETVGANGDESTVFQSDALLLPATGCAGTLAEWRESVGAWSAGNSRAVFSIACAAAGPLLALAGAEGGGFHFRGGTSTGKTTLLHVAASVFGPPAEAVRSWRTTSNALEGLAAMHNDGLLVLDELSQIDPDHAAEAAYMLANGHAKSRANRFGQPRKTATWRLLFLSSGEESLAALMRQTRRRPNPGQELRLADLPAEAGADMGVFEQLHEHESPAALALALKDAATRFHGTVGREWLAVVVKNRTALAEQLPERIREFCVDHVPLEAAGQVERVARRFALVAAAGELLAAYGLTAWPEGMAEQSAARCFQDWLANYGGGPRESLNVQRQVRLFFEMHGDSRFEPADGGDDNKRVTVNRAGFWRLDQSGNREYLVLRETFREEVCEGIDHTHAVKVLKESGWLLPDTDGIHNTQQVRLPGITKKTRCYVIGSKLWEGGVDDAI